MVELRSSRLSANNAPDGCVLLQKSLYREGPRRLSAPLQGPNTKQYRLLNRKSVPRTPLPFSLVPTGDETKYISKYQEGRIIGRGSYGTVFELHTKENGQVTSEPKFAVKKINLQEVELNRSKEDVKRMKQELAMLKTLDHPNIIKTHEVYENEKYIWEVMELCTGGDLLDRFSNMSKVIPSKISEVPSKVPELKKDISESEIIIIFRHIFKALAYLHNKNIAHRDLKPENLIWSTDQANAEIKLLDFGLANYNHIDESGMNTLRTRAGTYLYVAPEIAQNAPFHPYSPICDCWSAGIILHMMLTGEFPYIGNSDSHTLEVIVFHNTVWESSLYDKLSKPAVHILQRLLDKNPLNRISAQEALEHPWIKATVEMIKEPVMTAEESREIIKNFCRYQAAPELKKFSMLIIAKLCSDDQIKRLREIFCYLDKSHCGTLSVTDIRSGLKKGLQDMDVQIPKKYLEHVLECIDHNANGRIEYSEFIAASLYRKTALVQEVLEQAFAKLSTMRNGVNAIQTSDLESLLNTETHSEIKIDKKELQNLLNEVTGGTSGQLTLQDFTDMIKNPYKNRMRDSYEEALKDNNWSSTRASFLRNKPSPVIARGTKRKSEPVLPLKVNRPSFSMNDIWYDSMGVTINSISAGQISIFDNQNANANITHDVNPQMTCNKYTFSGLLGIINKRPRISAPTACSKFETKNLVVSPTKILKENIFKQSIETPVTPSTEPSAIPIIESPIKMNHASLTKTIAESPTKIIKTFVDKVSSPFKSSQVRRSPIQLKTSDDYVLSSKPTPSIDWAQSKISSPIKRVIDKSCSPLKHSCYSIQASTPSSCDGNSPLKYKNSINIQNDAIDCDLLKITSSGYSPYLKPNSSPESSTSFASSVSSTARRTRASLQTLQTSLMYKRACVVGLMSEQNSKTVTSISKICSMALNRMAIPKNGINTTKRTLRNSSINSNTLKVISSSKTCKPRDVPKTSRLPGRYSLSLASFCTSNNY